MKKQRILLIKGISQYDAMRNYIDELAIGFQNEGHSCTVLDGTDHDFQDVFINTLQKNTFDFVFTCNGIFMSPEVRAMMKSKFCTWIFDHPVHHMERLEQGDDNTLILCCDRKNVEYIKRYFPNIKHVDFVPLSGSYVKNPVPYSQRTIDLVFTGSNLMAEEALDRIKLQPEPIQNVAYEMINIIHHDTSLTIEESLAIALKNYEIVVNDQQFQDILFCTRDVSCYMRAYYREKIIRTIVEAGITIHVFGGGWETCDFYQKPNFIPCDGYGQTSLRAVANAKISLNVMPWFKDGFQERIAAAMLNGAIALTDSSKYIDENFKNNENIMIYSLNQIDQIPNMIHELLDDFQKSEEIAARGYHLAMEKHTFQCRASCITQILTSMEEKSNIK